MQTEQKRDRVPGGEYRPGEGDQSGQEPDRQAPGRPGQSSQHEPDRNAPEGRRQQIDDPNRPAQDPDDEDYDKRRKAREPD